VEMRMLGKLSIRSPISNECVISVYEPEWERDIELVSGTVIRARATSTLIRSDECIVESRLVFGDATVHKLGHDEFEYMTVGKKPPNWVLGADAATIVPMEWNAQDNDWLDSRHELKETCTPIRIAVGADPPTVGYRPWSPTFSVIEIKLIGDCRLGIREFHGRASDYDEYEDDE
ncbi:MAG: hypothetical protein FWD57_12170, partial [Polyangiaceae bacterium]|nr:hypothetical protein [Polyangiaceae bacterium]